MKPRLELEIRPQPDDATCGPTCLHAVYRFYGDRIPLRRVVDEVVALESGGTLAVLLGSHALRRGYAATIYTYNLELFDPTWFGPEARDLRPLLRAQAAVKDGPKLQVATQAYLEFLSLGGKIRFEELSARLIRRYLREDVPILTGLSATYLYGCARERGTDQLHYDDVEGSPTGHFVILRGFDRKKREVLVADPLQNNPRSAAQYYPVGIDRVTGAILLGVLTYDANFLILRPAGRAPAAKRRKR